MNFWNIFDLKSKKKKQQSLSSSATVFKPHIHIHSLLIALCWFVCWTFHRSFALPDLTLPASDCFGFRGTLTHSLQCLVILFTWNRTSLPLATPRGSSLPGQLSCPWLPAPLQTHQPSAPDNALGQGSRPCPGWSCQRAASSHNLLSFSKDLVTLQLSHLSPCQNCDIHVHTPSITNGRLLLFKALPSLLEINLC